MDFIDSKGIENNEGLIKDYEFPLSGDGGGLLILSN
jgi:hypothetical protein